MAKGGAPVDLDSLEESGTAGQPASGRRGRSRSTAPALDPGATKTATNATEKDRLADQNEALLEEISELKGQLEKAQGDGDGAQADPEEVGRLNGEIDRLNAALKKSSGPELRLPVTGTTIQLEMAEVDPATCFVSPKNGRNQTLLDDVSLRDLVASMASNGQQVYGLGRAVEGGKIEVIDGSRRLSATKRLGMPFKILLGAIPDPDVEELSETGNEHSTTSPWEIAQHYHKQIGTTYKDWNHVAAQKGWSNAKLTRVKKLVDVDETFVRCFREPAELTQKFGGWLIDSSKRDSATRKALLDAAKQLLEERAALEEGADWLDQDAVEKALKSSVRQKTRRPGQSKARYVLDSRGSVELHNKRLGIKATAGRRGDQYTLKVEGTSPEVFAEVLEAVRAKLSLK